MKKLRILYGLEAAEGGVLKHLLYLTSNLDVRRFDITVILSDLRGNIEEEIAVMKSNNVRIMKVPMMRSISPFRDLVAFVRIFSLLGNGYDVVHAHSSKAGALFCVAAWLRRVPKIYYTPHCFFFQGKTGLYKFVFTLLERLIGLFYTGLIVSDNEQREAIAHRLTPLSKIHNINNAIKFDDYARVERSTNLRKSFGVGPDDILVGAIGRLTLQKDWFTYIYVAMEVVAKQPRVKFMIVGDGELMDSIKHLVRTLNLQDNVMITGYIKDIHRIYSILDVFVSTSRWEGLPYVFLEAMYYKLPIIATDTGNGAAIINGKTGYLVALKDYQALAYHISCLISDSRACAQMGINALTHLKNKYSFKVFIERHERLYN